jgi:hypothetical protein
LALLPGCQLLGAVAYYFSPRHIQKAEFELTAGRLAIVIDPARSEYDNPVFSQALHAKLAEIFQQQKVNSQIVPYRETTDLRRANPDFASWSIQRVGRALSAEHVLYLRVDSFQLRESPGHPVIAPSVTLRAKVVGAQAPPPHTRLWPTEAEGRTITCSRDPQEATDAELIDAEAMKLGRDTAQLVSRFFFDVDLEEPVPKER